LPTTDTSCLYTTFKNTSGKTKYFGFLPPHGRKLLPNQEITIFGGIEQMLQHDIERVTSRPYFQAFEEALQNGLIQVLKTPAPILLDATTGLNKMLTLDGGTLGVADPCWESAETVTDLEPF